MMENEKPNLSAEPVSRCIKCNVTVESGKRCPLCHTPIRGGGISDVSYPEYVPKYSDNRRFTLFRLFSFLSIVTGVLCTMINIFTFQKGSTLWSAIVITFLLFGWSALFTLRNKHINTAGKTLLFYLLIITGMLLIDIWSGFDKWSTTYVIPFVTMAVILYVTLLASIGKKRYKEYLGYLIVTMLTSICPFLMFLFSLTDVLWTSVATLVYSFLTAIGLLIFADRDFKTEIRKRFNY